MKGVRACVREEPLLLLLISLPVSIIMLVRFVGLGLLFLYCNTTTTTTICGESAPRAERNAEYYLIPGIAPETGQRGRGTSLNHVRCFLLLQFSLQFSPLACVNGVAGVAVARKIKIKCKIRHGGDLQLDETFPKSIRLAGALDAGTSRFLIEKRDKNLSQVALLLHCGPRSGQWSERKRKKMGKVAR